MSRESIAACLIVQNEETRLAAALRSVSFCDEVIVVDGGSTDRTRSIAKAAGAKVLVNPWPGFAAQRNFALDAARSEWILELDADERVSERLRASIEELLEIAPAEADLALFPLRNHFLGRAIGPSAKYPAYRARLFRRGAYRHDESRDVHEGIQARSRPLILNGDLEHMLAGSLREALTDVWRYARLESGRVLPPGSFGAGAKAVLLRPAAKFAYRTIIDQGWQDGWRGLLKILLDSASDSLVWLFAIARPQARIAVEGSLPAAEHFGRQRSGTPKLVAISDASMRAAAMDWLEHLAAAGIDVALITEELPRDKDRAWQGGVRSGSGSIASRDRVGLHLLRQVGPVRVLRALEIEDQIRSIDAVVAIGKRTVGFRRLAPRGIWPQAHGLKIGMSAQEVAEIIASRRAPTDSAPGRPPA